jgi:hypothetical protein
MKIDIFGAPRLSKHKFNGFHGSDCKCRDQLLDPLADISKQFALRLLKLSIGNLQHLRNYLRDSVALAFGDLSGSFLQSLSCKGVQSRDSSLPASLLSQRITILPGSSELVWGTYDSPNFRIQVLVLQNNGVMKVALGAGYFESQ